MGPFITPDSTVTKIEVKMDQCLAKLILRLLETLAFIHHYFFSCQFID